MWRTKPQGVEAFLQAYEDSIAYMSDPDNLEDAAQLVAQYEISPQRQGGRRRHSPSATSPSSPART